jgi:hypothetical protein
MTKMAAGKYICKLVDGVGRIINKNDFIYEGGSGLQFIELGNKMPAGIYYLQISGPGDYLNSFKLIL